MTLHIKAMFHLQGRLRIMPPKMDYRFRVSTGEANVEIRFLERGTLEVFLRIEPSTDFMERLRANENMDSWPEETLDELYAITQYMWDGVNQFVSGLKFYLANFGLNHGGSLRDQMWSDDEETWNSFPPSSGRSVAGCAVVHARFEPYIADGLQSFLDGKTQFLHLAFQHLHQAYSTESVRQKWVETTIAAELAIKEFLIIKFPNIETLLLEMPSPPLDKLYRNVLHSMIGEESPKWKQIGKGAAKRNKIVHKAQKFEITMAEANRYIKDVEVAMSHLLVHLNPNDEVLRKLYEDQLYPLPQVATPTRTD